MAWRSEENCGMASDNDIIYERGAEMSLVEKRLEENGITLPNAPQKGGLYSPCVKYVENLVYVSGCGPNIDDQVVFGKLGKEYSVEEGMAYAKDAMRNVLAALKAEVGDLDKVFQPVKILVYVNSTDDFYEQPVVANGGSEVLQQAFGAVPARSAIGVNVLPGNIPVEIEAIFELKE